MATFKNALVSVSNKSGLVEFLKPLVAKGLRVVSTGGTAQHLRDAGIKVVDISEQTGFPEVMDGRVKTLHPKVHMALLARMDQAEDLSTLRENKLELFDLVIGNLYPFADALSKGKQGSDLIEYIDVGGPSFLRAAAKNHESVTVLCDPKDYQWVAEKESISLDDRKKLAAKVFAHVSAYDSLIAQTLSEGEVFSDHSLGGTLVQSLRYGENPQQKAFWFKTHPRGLHGARVLQGKELSFNNLLDIEAAIKATDGLKPFGAVGVKHNNPCGVAVADSLSGAVKKMVEADPISIFGGIVAVTSELDAASAKILSEIFLECVVAPKVSAEALSIFQKKKNLRVLEFPVDARFKDQLDHKTVNGGLLVQTKDFVSLWESDWKIIGKKPSGQIELDLGLAWFVCAQLKSNAISIVSQGQTVGLGMGQVNRVDAVRHAIGRMRDQHPQAQNPVLASDGFFPFSDSIDIASEAGIKWIIQPGGSLRDEEVIGKAQELEINMVLTGRRHFRH